MNYFTIWWRVWVLAGFTLTARAQAPYFNERYPFVGFQTLAGATLPTSSGYLVCGMANITTPTQMPSLLLRSLDANGQQQWAEIYGRPGDRYYATQSDGGWLHHPSGGYMLISNRSRNGQSAPMIWRFGEQGDTLWTRVLPDTAGRVANSGLRLPNGDFVLAGYSYRTTPGRTYDVMLIRTDSTGRPRWTRYYGSRRFNIAWHVHATPDGGFLLSGQQYNYGNERIPYVLKTDSLGALEWERTFDAPLTESGAAAAIPLAAGGYLVAAPLYHHGRVLPWYQLTFWQVNAAGDTLASRTLGPLRTRFSVNILRGLADGSAVVAGQYDTDDLNVNNREPIGYAAKVCADGDSLWWREYRQLTGGTSHNYLRGFEPTPDGGFVGSGFLFAYPPDSGSNDTWVFRCDSAGNLLANGPPPAPGASCALPLGLPAPAGAVAAVSVYPNPASDGRFTISGLGPGAALAVHDALGRVVWRGTVRSAETGVDLSSQPAGLYLLRVAWADGRTITKKLVR